MSQTHFERLVMILRSAGFVNKDLMSGQNAVNFAYIIYLRGRALGANAADIESAVRRWYVMSILTGRYSGNPESNFDFDIRQIGSRGVLDYVSSVVEAELSDGFWSTLLPQEMETSASTSPYFRVYLAAQAKLGDKGFLSKDITVTDLILNRSDVHHIFPKKFLKDQGLGKGKYNQIANYAIAQSEINIAIGHRAPEKYFAELALQCRGGKKRYGAITDIAELKHNLEMHCIPVEALEGTTLHFDSFLEERRKLMAGKIRLYFEKL